MKHPPAVSVVVATRNYGRFLGNALRSILSQTWNDFEVVVIDDGSTDNTPRVVQPFLADARVRYHRTNGLGQSRAKNLGIQLSRAPLIAFLDGDDEWLPAKLERQLPLFCNPEVGVVYARRTLMNEAGDDLPTPAAEPARGRIFDVLLIRNPVCFSSAVVRRQAIESLGLFDSNLPLGIDYDLWLRVARHLEFDFVDEPLVRYRTGHANLSSRLAERSTAVLSILERSLVRRRNGVFANNAAVRTAWGSTFRSLAHGLGPLAPLRSAAGYFRAARHDRGWLHSLKSTARCVLGFISAQFSNAGKHRG